MSGAPDGQLMFDVDDLDDLDELLATLLESGVGPQEPQEAQETQETQEAQEPLPVPCTGPSEYEQHGQRPATEQQVAQAAADDTPGWTDGKDSDGTHGGHGTGSTDCCAGEGNDLGYRIASVAAACAGQNGTDHQRLTGAVASGRQNAALGPPANPQPPLSGPLLRQGSRGRGRAGAAPAQPVSQGPRRPSSGSHGCWRTVARARMARFWTCRRSHAGSTAAAFR